MNAVVGCPFCGVEKRGHALRCHIQSCSARNKPTGGKNALGMVDNVRTVGGGNRRVGRVRKEAQSVGPVHAVKCAGCIALIDDEKLGGYVCLTCIDRELVRLQSQNLGLTVTSSGGI